MKNIKVNINRDTLLDRLKDEMSSGDNADLISEAVISMLESNEDYLGKLFMATLGIVPDPPGLEIGKVLYVDKNLLHLWRFDEDQMIADKYLIKDQVSCAIDSYNFYTEFYTVSYAYINSSGELLKEISQVSGYALESHYKKTIDDQ